MSNRIRIFVLLAAVVFPSQSFLTSLDSNTQSGSFSGKLVGSNLLKTFAIRSSSYIPIISSQLSTIFLYLSNACCNGFSIQGCLLRAIFFDSVVESIFTNPSTCLTSFKCEFVGYLASSSWSFHITLRTILNPFEIVSSLLEFLFNCQ